jgi:hypothetical protein
MEEETKIVQNMPAATRNKNLMIPLAAAIIIILLGVVTGYGLTRSGSTGNSTIGTTGTAQKGQEVGSTNQVFKDTATGVLQAGGIDGEGTHQLIREGGPSQTAYLNSSVIDLDQYVGKKVQVWGETNKGQKASWLMDVGKLKVLE